jgi:hypothetical protein
VAIIRMPNAFREAKDPVEQSMKIGQIDLMQKQKGATAVNTALTAMKLGDAVMESKPINAMAREVGSWFGDEGSTDRGEKLFDEYGKDKKTQTTTPPKPDPDKKKQEAVRAATLGEVAQQGMAEQGFNLSSVQGVRDAGAALNKREEARQIIAKRESERAAAAAMPKGNLGQEDWKALRAEKTGPNSFEMTRNETQAETARYLAANAPFVWEDTVAYVKEMFSPEVGEAVAANVSPDTPAQQVANVVVAAEAAKAFGESPDQAAANANPASAQSGVSQVFTQPQGPVAAGSGTLRGAGQGALDQAQAIATDPQRAVKLIDSAEGRMQRVMAYAQQIAKQRENEFPSKDRLNEMDVEALIALGQTHELTDDQKSMVEYLISKRAVFKNLSDLAGRQYIRNAKARFTKNVADAEKGRYRDPVEIAKDLVTMEHKLQQGRTAQARADKLTIQSNYLNEIGRAKAFNEWMHYFGDPDFLKVWGRNQMRIKGGASPRAQRLMEQWDYTKPMNDTSKNEGSEHSNAKLLSMMSTGGKRDAAAARTVQDSYKVMNSTTNIQRMQQETTRKMTLMNAQLDEIKRKGRNATPEEKAWASNYNKLKRAYEVTKSNLLEKQKQSGPYYTPPIVAQIEQRLTQASNAIAQHELGKPDAPAPRPTPNRTPSRPAPPPAAAPTYGSKQEVLDAYASRKITKEKARALIAAGFGG